MPRANFSVFFAAAAPTSAQVQPNDGPRSPPSSAAPDAAGPAFMPARLASLDKASIPPLPGFGSRQTDEDPILLCDGENAVIELFPRQRRSQNSPSQQP